MGVTATPNFNSCYFQHLIKYLIILKKAPLKQSQNPVEREIKNNRISLEIRNEKDQAEAAIQ